MDRSPLLLAAMASVAVPGLDPVTVEALPSLPHDRFDVAFVMDTEHRRWVVRAPRSQTAGADLESAVALTGLLARRVGFSVPVAKGFFGLGDTGRAVVYPYLPGDPVDFSAIVDGPGVAGEIGRVLAAIHNVDPALVDEAGLPSYDADAYRSRRLADLDRAAGTGRVPTTLLTRWERALEDVSLWRFAPTTTHGRLSGDCLLLVLDGEDEATGKVRGVVGWEHAKVADPADDFSVLVEDASPAVLERIMEAYAHARLDRPDSNLLVRARLASELDLLRELTDAIAREDAAAVDGLSSRLRRLDDLVHSLEESSDDYQRMSLSPTGVRTRPTAPPAIEETDEDEDLPSVVGPPDTDAAAPDQEARSVGEEPDEVDESDGPGDHDAGTPDPDAHASDADAPDADASDADSPDSGQGPGRGASRPAGAGRAETVEIRVEPPS